MITIIYSSHKGQKYNEDFNKHLKETIGVKNYEILPYENYGEFSLAQIYNKGIKESKYDIVCCIHNDIKLEKGWGQKLLKDYSKYPEFGIIGKAGSCYFPESGVYWEKMNETMVGQVYHHPPGQKKWLSEYSSKFPFLIPVVTIDGLFISFNKTKIKHQFDESFGKFHFYDHGFCLPNYLDDVKIGVTTSFEITHQSVGQPNKEFFESKDKFVEKWGNKLPIDLKPNIPYFEEIKKKQFKKFGKVAVIIPSKSNISMLKNCLDSYIVNCDKRLFDIFIADTGSSNEEIHEIEEYIKNNSDNVKIHLIKYDYYNFASINNDVVKNFISDNFEFLLFSNNDIKVLNDVITGMLSVYQMKNKIGTVGARLHYEDSTVQHDGMLLYLNPRDKSAIVTHRNKNSYYKFTKGVNVVLGNTAALMMVRKEDFTKRNMFNENYLECFEDVELNLLFLTYGCQNLINSDCVAIHYESKTRNINNENIIKDYNNNLFPFIKKNLEKIKSQIFVKN